MSGTQQIVYRKHTFLSAVAMGLSAVIIVTVLCCTGVIIYGMHFAGSQTGRLISVTAGAIDGAPEFINSLPPLIGDVLNDRRMPAYAGQIEATARVVPGQDHNGRTRVQVQVANNGDELITLLSMRITVVDSNGEVLREENQWAATPVAGDNDWRGPLMPNSNRRMTCPMFWGSSNSPEDLTAEIEITDIRVWTEEPRTVITHDPLINTETAAPLIDAAAAETVSTQPDHQ